ncbi:MAG: competence protein ComGC [Oleiphilaceae bacterium]|jgi:competence protein ComGC
MLKKQAGFTIIEVSISVAVLISILLFSAPMIKKKAEDALVYQTLSRIKIIYESTIRFRVNTGGWPASVAVLETSNYIPNRSIQTAWGVPFNLIPSGGGVNLAFSTPTEGVATRLAGLMIAPTITGGTNITERITPTGQAASLTQLQDLAGTRVWTDDWNAGSNNLFNANNIVANSTDSNDFRTDTLQLQTLYPVGGACLAGQLGISTASELLVCNAGLWEEAVSTLTISNRINGNSSVSGLTPGDVAWVTVFGITANRGNGGATMQGVRLTNCGSSTLGSTRTVSVNWPDGNAPQVASFPATVPANGRFCGRTDNGNALNISVMTFSG